MTNSVNTREIALDILMEINEKEQYLHILLNDALRKFQYLEKNERAFISKLVRGTIERRLTLDYVVNQVSSVPVNKMKPLIRNLMRMSVYQMMYMEQVPASAVCNEAVKLAQKRKFTSLKGFVNGVLRNISRKLPDMELPTSASIKYSMPQELVDMWNRAYGEDETEVMLKTFLEDKKLSVITNTTKITAEELKSRLEAEGLTVEGAPYIKDAFIISGINYLDELDSFNEGLFQIQDISSMLEGVIASPKENDYIIDVCAAPGGKSIFAAIKLNGTGNVEARDVTPMKVAQIDENVTRLELTNVVTEVRDALEIDEESVNKADIVLADLPCSGLGIIGRKPDIKYNVTLDKTKQIVKLQRDILDVITGYVKPGGYIIYSTCTLNKAENEDNVKYICEKGFDAVDICELIPEMVYSDTKAFSGELHEKLVDDAKNGYITLLPGIHDCDGFFVAKLRKK